MELNLYLVDWSYVDIASSVNNGTPDNISFSCNYGGVFFIRIARGDFFGSVQPFTITVSGSIQSGIPGFEIPFLLIGLIGIILIHLYWRNSKSKLETPKK